MQSSQKLPKEVKTDKSWFNDFQRKSKYIDNKSQKSVMQEWSVLEKIHLTFDNICCSFMGT